MIRVAQVMAGAEHGGAELFFERLCCALHAAGECVLPIIRTNAERANILRNDGMKPQQLAFGSAIDVLTRLRLRHILRTFAPQVVVSWMNRASLHTPRGEWVHVGRLGGYYDLGYYKHCDHLVGNTRGIVRWLRDQGWPDERTHYLPNFVQDFSNSQKATDIPSGRPLLLALGRLHNDKGFDTLIHAMPRLPFATLLIAGEGPERHALQTLARREHVADRVHFLGWRKDPGRLLKAADVFVSSSRIEPLGNMIIEAWSAARPVVAMNAAGPRELIRHGSDGLLTPLEDHVALAFAITSLLDDPTRTAAMANAGRERFVTEYAIRPVVARWRNFLKSVST